MRLADRPTKAASPDCTAIGSTVEITIEPGSARNARSTRGVIRTRLIRTAPDARQA
jgi:hypothetical protein